MPNYIQSLSEVLHARRPLDVPYFGSTLRIAYNPGAFDDDLMEGLREAEAGDLMEAVTDVLDGLVDDPETVAGQIVEVVQNVAGQQSAATYILDALKRTVTEVNLKDEDGKPVVVAEVLDRFPLPLRGAIFNEMTQDMRSGQKKSTPSTDRKRKVSKRPRSSFDAAS